MKNFTRMASMMLLGFVMSITHPAVSAQSISHPNTGQEVHGDLMHAASGNNFVGMVYLRSGDIYYNQITIDGTWGEEQILGVGSEARMAVDVNNNVHVVFTSSGKIAYFTFDGHEWSNVEYIESNFEGSCSKPDIATDSHGNGHITYTDTRGNTGDHTDHPDIMYATNSTGSFVKTLIHNGYYEHYGSRYGVYFEKGSFISIDNNDNYYILSHKRIFENWGVGIDHNHYIEIRSNLGSGSIYGHSSNATSPFDLYDFSTNGTDVIVLYRHAGMKTAQLSLNEGLFSFIDIQPVDATAVSSVAVTANHLVTGGRSSTSLFTKHNELAHTYSGITVKGTVVSLVNIDEAFYAIYSDNGDGFIKIREVAIPLSITRFELAEQTGPAYIDGISNSIAIEVGTGTDLTELTAAFANTVDVSQLEVNGVAQVSGITVNDFSAPVVYSLSDGENTRLWNVIVTEAPIVYTINITSNPVEGGTTSGDGEYIEGDPVTVNATAAEGYRFKHWAENGENVSTNNEYVFTAEENRNLEAIFVEQYTLTILVDGSGTVETNGMAYTEIITADSGTEITLEAVADNEHHFSGWSGDLESTVNPTAVTLNGNKTVTANFNINQYTLTIIVDGLGTVETNGMAYTEIIIADSGTEITLEAVADNEHHFSSWSGDLESTVNPTAVTLNGNKTVTANFNINQYTLTIVVDGLGTVETNGIIYTEAITADSGTEITLEAVADNEHHFTEWSGDIESTVNPNAITMNGNKVVTASFQISSTIDNKRYKTVQIYPNPVIEKVYFEYSSGIKRVLIYDATGKLLLEANLKGSNSLFVGNLKEGLYIISLETINGEIYKRKIIKQ